MILTIYQDHSLTNFDGKEFGDVFALHDNSIHLNDLKKVLPFNYYVSLNDNHSVINFSFYINS
jgi:hypothetical protein